MRFGLKTLNETTEVKKNCLVCDSEISGSYLAIKTAKDEYCAHLSCTASGLVMAINGIALLVSWLKEKDSENLIGKGD